MHNPYESHLAEKIMGASPMELSVMLFSAAQESISRARKCLYEKDIMARSAAVSKAMAIVVELDASVDESRGGEVAKRLRELYAYALNNLQRGHVIQEEQPFIEAGKVLEILREGFVVCQPATVEAPAYHTACSTPESARYTYAA